MVFSEPSYSYCKKNKNYSKTLLNRTLNYVPFLSSFKNPEVVEKYFADSLTFTSAACGFTISKPWNALHIRPLSNQVVESYYLKGRKSNTGSSTRNLFFDCRASTPNLLLLQVFLQRLRYPDLSFLIHLRQANPAASSFSYRPSAVPQISLIGIFLNLKLIENYLSQNTITQHRHQQK